MAGVIKMNLDVGDAVSDTLSVAYAEATIQHIIVANGASDTSVGLGGVTTADVVYLKSDQQLTINFNSSSGTDITIDANRPALLTGTSVTALYVSNASGSNANVDIKFWGA